MWLKAAGCLLVVAASTLFGFSLAARYTSRPQQVRQLINGISALQSNIRYASAPLTVAFEQSARGLSGPVAQLFLVIGRLLRQDASLTPREAIGRALAAGNAELSLRHQETEAVILFGSNLGQMNREEQVRYCDLLMAQLATLEQNALTLRDQNVNMYRYLGVCGGLAAAILLI